jgi:hypothetical protein
MADKSPHKSNGKKPGKTLKEKRAVKKLKRDTPTSFTTTMNQRRQ